MGEVHQFPINRVAINNPIVTVDKCHEIATDLLLQELIAAGYPLNSEEYVKDVALIFAAVRSAMLKSKNMVHPFQPIAEDIFVHKGDGIVELNINLESRLDTEHIRNIDEDIRGEDPCSEGPSIKGV